MIIQNLCPVSQLLAESWAHFSFGGVAASALPCVVFFAKQNALREAIPSHTPQTTHIAYNAPV
jgi:hypothetical protein